jgi:hypothetical protein
MPGEEGRKEVKANITSRTTRYQGLQYRFEGREEESKVISGHMFVLVLVRT